MHYAIDSLLRSVVSGRMGACLSLPMVERTRCILSGKFLILYNLSLGVVVCVCVCVDTRTYIHTLNPKALNSRAPARFENTLLGL